MLDLKILKMKISIHPSLRRFTTANHGFSTWRQRRNIKRGEKTPQTAYHVTKCTKCTRYTKEWARAQNPETHDRLYNTGELLQLCKTEKKPEQKSIVEINSEEQHKGRKNYSEISSCFLGETCIGLASPAWAGPCCAKDGRVGPQGRAMMGRASTRAGLSCAIVRAGPWAPFYKFF